MENRTVWMHRAPWILLPCVVLTLGGVSLLAPQAASVAAVPSSPPAARPADGAVYDDGDGDELLEHWDNPIYSKEERVQIAGSAAGFLLLGAVVFGKRRRTQSQATLTETRLTLVDVSASSAGKRRADQTKAA